MDYEQWGDYKIITLTSEDVYLNDQFHQRGYVTGKASYDLIELNDQGAIYQGQFQSLEQTHVSDGQVLELNSQYESILFRDFRGYMEIDEEYLYPVLRNMIVFPEEELSPGDSWSEVGTEVHDLSRSYDVTSIRFPRTVHYTYMGEVPGENGSYYLIETESFFQVEPLLGSPTFGYFYPYQVSGESSREIYWNPELGRPELVKEEFRIVLYMADLQWVEYVGTRESRYEYSLDIDHEQEMEDLQNILDDQGITDTELSADDDGLILTLNQIHFAPDSYEILPEERQRLQTMAEILERFPNRDVQITGHTADVGNPVFQLELSRDRAAAVAQYLQGLLPDRAGLFITQGMGGTQPVADNRYEEGRQQNRRVELKILDN